MNRRQFLAVAATTATTATAGCVGSGPTDGDLSPLGSERSIALESVAEGFREPVAFQTARGDRLRYVADKYGRIAVHDESGVRETPFLDVSDQLAELSTWEQGLLGFELHPEFETSRKCYVRYSAPRREGTPAGFSHTFVLSEFRARPDLRTVDPDSERTLLEIPEQGPNHNSGAIVFGPDGYLYVGVGDGHSRGGDRGTGHAEDWYWLNAGGNGQDVTENLRGSVLRLDVDDRANGKPYAIPDDNPLVGEDGLDEQYAWGFRNPYRMSFSGEDLYVGDVGKAHVEEVNRVEKGGNYGWNVREGTRCHANRYALAALAKLPWFDQTYPVCPDETPDGDPLIDPVVAYPHDRDGEPFGRAVVAGYRYENETVPAIRDEYVFGDLSGIGSGLYAATPTEEGRWPMRSLDVVSGPEMANRFVLSFGRDAAGELYVLTTQFAEGTGAVHRIVTPES
ncbi:PQQ-dependent sugar dehydrogenase [Halorussus marinus]|uniref:PQQ-dependent sugar dehydrogenase n=1 Tax=Halorussus marinus TaxID=2505976 RepID=UPI001092F322|nr:PQQ-dependent sugar dehydrogenase [Halorussus marinus]